MSTTPLYKHRYIGLRNSCWAEISVFLMVIHDYTATAKHKPFDAWNPKMPGALVDTSIDILA